MRHHHRGRPLSGPFLLLVCASLLNAGCQTLPPPATPQEAVRLDVPFYPQDRYQCGPAALASVLSYSGYNATPEQLAAEVWLPGRRGSLTMDLVAAARARGALVYPVRDPDALAQELRAGHPVLVQQNLLFSWLPRWHFAVVTAYDPAAQRLTLHSGKRRNMGVSWKWFARRWQLAEHVGYVFLPPGELPASAQPQQLAAAIHDVEISSQEPATSFWHAAVLRFGGDTTLRFGLANALAAQGDASEAVREYLRLLQQDPEVPAAWNNLADTLNREHCEAAAHAAISRALHAEPGNTLYQGTREEISTAGSPGPHCQHWLSDIRNIARLLRRSTATP